MTGLPAIRMLRQPVPSTMLELQTIRNTVKSMNAMLRRSGTKPSSMHGEIMHRTQRPVQFYVKCQGRGPRVKHALAQGSFRRRFDQCLPLGLAERMDVYVYQR